MAELGYFVSVGHPKSSGGQIEAYFLGFLLIMAGLVIAGPWLTMAGSRVMARRTSHPAVLILMSAPTPASTVPTMVRDQEKDLWGAVFPLPLEIKGTPDPTPLNVQLILIGAAMV